MGGRGVFFSQNVHRKYLKLKKKGEKAAKVNGKGISMGGGIPSTSEILD